MKPRKKNSFWTFIFSFIPGAAEMYMGFMKSGLSILVAFMVPFLVTGIFYGRDYLAMLSVIVYVVAFFHARNIESAPDDQFNELEDKYVWEEFIDTKSFKISNEKCRKWGAIVLIILGADGIWGMIRELLFNIIENMQMSYAGAIGLILDGIPNLVVSVLVIIAGILLIRGKKKELTEEE